MADQLREHRESTQAAREAMFRSEAQRAWIDLQEAVRSTAEGKRYKGELFLWRVLPAHPKSLVLKNVALSFVEREWDSRTFTLLLGGIPGLHALWATTSPDPEFVDIQYEGRDHWRIGGSTEVLQTSGENSAAEHICRALVTYFDDFQSSRCQPII
ncbi:hypothetical protein [Occallatibacter riparius]|uniref:Uncharacterized protein n=1 Tax=Occallatibacter riparius TaxID=1002689 RepID=A0A9J7BHN4_9BACT|nr:hypothetical protein [Occallatibacter riparius]UWZ82468.1 hypothetical protein MOP44_18050 [Occallatibacter riparius]